MGESSVSPPLSTRLRRLLFYSIASSFLVATLYYIALFGSAPILFIIFDAAFYIFISVPLSIVSALLLAKTRSRTMRFLIMAFGFLVVSFAAVWFSLQAARNGGLSQKISGNWVYLDGEPTAFGIAVVLCKGLVLAGLTACSLWFAMLRERK